MKADLVDIMAITKANLTSTLCYINDLAESDTKLTRRSLECIIQYLKVVATEMAENSPKEYRESFLSLIRESSQMKSSSKSPLKLTNGTATRKNSMSGGSGKGFQLSRFQAKTVGPTKRNKATAFIKENPRKVRGAVGAVAGIGAVVAAQGLALTALPAGAAAAVAAAFAPELSHAVSQSLDYLRIDQETRNLLRRLTKIQERALERGNIAKADEIGIRVSEIREVYDLLPAASPYAVAALIIYCTYMTPTWAMAVTKTASSITVALPIAGTALFAGKASDKLQSGVSAVGNGAAWVAGRAATAASRLTGSQNEIEFSNPLNFGTSDYAMDWANSTGKETNRLVGGLIDSVTPPEAREVGYMAGFFVFGLVLTFASLKYNAMVLHARGEARERRLKAQQRLGTMLDEGEKKLLKNIAVEEEDSVNQEMNEILTYFRLTEDQKTKPLNELKEIVKEKYTERIRVEHPNKGGSGANFDRTKQMYNKFKDLTDRINLK